MNQHARKHAAAGLTSDIWSDEKFAKKARALVVEHGLTLGDAAKRLKISHGDLGKKAHAEGWLKAKAVTPRRTTVAELPKPVGTLQVSLPKAPTKPARYPPLPGSSPKPFHDKERSECGFILEDFKAGGMDEAMTCCMVRAEDSAYCLGHLDLLMPNRHEPKTPKSRTPAHELARKLRRYL